MTSSINWVDRRKQIDADDMFARIHGFPDQLRAARDSFADNTLVLDSREYQNVLLLGMGGSAIGGDVVRASVEGECPVPVVVQRGYEVPAWTDDATLVIATSYSGNTEETLSAVTDALDRGASPVFITSGGKLGRLAEERGYTPISVPKGFPPRTAMGYLAVPTLLVLEQLALTNPWAEDLEEAIALTSSLRKEWKVEDGPGNGYPAEVAATLAGKMPVVYHGTGEMDPVATRWVGQFAENSETLAHRHTIPELNHNEIMGWRNPEKMLKETALLFLRNEHDHPRVFRAMPVVRDLIEERAGGCVDIPVQGRSTLARILSTIYLGDWISYYLALAQDVDPTPVPRIDRLKAELA